MIEATAGGGGRGGPILARQTDVRPDSEVIMSGGTFDNLTHVFESIIAWPKRLAHEAPFYRGLFERVGVKRVVNVACGTGHHAAMFQSWGLQVEGADLSPNMIAQARAGFGEPPGLTWAVRGYDQPIQPPAPLMQRCAWATHWLWHRI